MMGRRAQDQEQLFYSFNLEEAVPEDHLVREIAAVLDLNWVYEALAPHYAAIGRPSIDPVLMIRMLIVGSKSIWLTAGSSVWALRISFLFIRPSRGPAMSVLAKAISSDRCSSAVLRPALRPIWLAVKGLPWMQV